MKIIGASSHSRYIVEVAGYELQALSGLSVHPDQWKIGTEIEVMKSVHFLRDLRSKEEAVRNGVKAMTALGEMLSKGIPSFIVSPPEEETVRGDPS